MFGLTRMDMLGAGRSALHVGARTYASVRLRTELGLSLILIGRLLNRDHTSILNLLRKAEGVPVSVRNGVAMRRKRAMEK
jgi:chromosomal replication initiation ATPase DnaA